MTSTKTSTGWNATAGSNLTDHFQTERKPESSAGEESEEIRKELKFHEERAEYFQTEYDVKTGLRIAATLGGFFLLVLVTLLYKSKCKKSSREPSPPPRMDPNGHNLALLAASIHHHPLTDETTFSRLPKTGIECEFEDELPGHHPTRSVPFPQVFLTQPNDSSQSSNESELSLSSFRGRESSLSSGGPLPLPGPSHPRPKVRKKRKAGPSMNWLKQNIDIHVIQPTPTISPSGSTNFHPPLSRRAPRDCTMHRGSDSDAALLPATLGHRTSSSAASPSSICNPLFFLNADNSNIRYMDDTSSENIPTRASDFEDEGEDVQSLGSDSVFNFQSRGDFEAEEGEGECRVTLTRAHAQVHHRDSYCSSEYESVNDYLESARRRSSSTQTTFSDLRQCVGFGLMLGTVGFKSEAVNHSSLNENPTTTTENNTCRKCSVGNLTVNYSLTPNPAPAPIIPTSPSPIPMLIVTPNANHPHKPPERKRSHDGRENIQNLNSIGEKYSKSE